MVLGCQDGGSLVVSANGGVTLFKVTLILGQGDLAILVGVRFIEGHAEGIENQRAGLRFRKGDPAAARLVDLAEILRSSTRGHVLPFGHKAVTVGIIHGEGIGDDQAGRFLAAHRAIPILVRMPEFLLRGGVGSGGAACQHEDGDEDLDRFHGAEILLEEAEHVDQKDCRNSPLNGKFSATRIHL